MEEVAIELQCEDKAAIELQCEDKAMAEHAFASNDLSTADEDGVSVKSNHSNACEEDHEVFSARSKSSKSSDQSAFTAGLNFKNDAGSLERGLTLITKKSTVSFESREEPGEIPMPSFSGEHLPRTVSSGSNLNIPGFMSPYTSGSRSPIRRNSWPLQPADSASDALAPTQDWQSEWDKNIGVGPPMLQTLSDNVAHSASRRRMSFDLGDCRTLTQACETPKMAGIRDARLLAERRKKDSKTPISERRHSDEASTPINKADTSRQAPVENEHLIAMIANLDAKMNLLLEASKTHGKLLRAGSAPLAPEASPSHSPVRSRRFATEGSIARQASSRLTPLGLSGKLPSKDNFRMQELPGALGAFDDDLNSPRRSKSGEYSPKWGTEENLKLFRSAFEAQQEVKPDLWNSNLLSPVPNKILSPMPSPKRSQSRANSAASAKSQGSAVSIASTASSASACFGGAAFQTVMSHQERSDMTQKVWLILDEPDSVPHGNRITFAMDSFTIISVCFTFIQLMSIWRTDSWVPRVGELGIDGLYLIEISMRFIVCPNRRRFFSSFYNVNDLIASGPVLILRSCALWMFVSANSPDALTTADDILLCLVPVLRLLKLLRRFQKFSLLFKAFALAFEALPVLLFTLSMIILMFSSLLYLLESRENIPHFGVAVYATTITFTTVGYGDVTPETNGGRIAMCVVGMASGLYMALPLGIIGSAFKEVWDDRDRLILLRRIRKTLLDLSLTAYDIPSLFRYFDEDKDGVLSIAEFGKMVLQMHLNMSNKRINELFTIVDKNADGGIDDEEFTRSLFPTEYAIVYGPDALDNEDSESPYS